MEFLRNLWLPGNRVCLHLPIFSHAVVAGAQCPKYYCEIFFAYLSSYNTSSFKMVFQAMFPAMNSSRIWRILELFHVSLGNCNGSKQIFFTIFYFRSPDNIQPRILQFRAQMQKRISGGRNIPCEYQVCKNPNSCILIRIKNKSKVAIEIL